MPRTFRRPFDDGGNRTLSLAVTASGGTNPGYVQLQAKQADGSYIPLRGMNTDGSYSNLLGKAA